MRERDANEPTGIPSLQMRAEHDRAGADEDEQEGADGLGDEDGGQARGHRSTSLT